MLLTEAPLKKPQDWRGVVTLPHWGRGGGGGRRYKKRSTVMVSVIRQLVYRRRPSFFTFPAVRVTYATAALKAAATSKDKRAAGAGARLVAVSSGPPRLNNPGGFTFRFPGKLRESAWTFAVLRPNWCGTGADKFGSSVSFVSGRYALSEAVCHQTAEPSPADWQTFDSSPPEWNGTLRINHGS